MTIFQPRTRDVDDGRTRVSEAIGERGHWYLWLDTGDYGHVSGEYDRLTLSPWIKTDTLVDVREFR